MAEKTALQDPNFRLIGGGEIAIAVAALAHITAVIVMRAHFPVAHDIWVAVTDLLTRGMAYVFAVIDGHSIAYRPVLSSARIEEMRAVYATNRLFILILLCLAIARTAREDPAIRWYLSTRLPIAVKRLFWLCAVMILTVPIAAYGISQGFAEQTFFEFQFGINLINDDIYYYLDFLLFLVIAWQFLFFLPSATYFTGRTAYGHVFAPRKRAAKRRSGAPETRKG